MYFCAVWDQLFVLTRTFIWRFSVSTEEYVGTKSYLKSYLCDLSNRSPCPVLQKPQEPYKRATYMAFLAQIKIELGLTCLDR